MRVLGTIAVALVVIAACATEREYPSSMSEPSVIEPEISGSSALDALDADNAATFEGPRRELADLIVAPGALGDDMQLARLEVDDPNETGRVDGRWYPPQVRTEDCAIRVDTPPMPSAAAAFIPGDPDVLLGDNGFAGQQSLLEAPLSVSIQLQVFDDSSQRDGLADAMVEFYRTMGTLECEAMGSVADDLTSELLGNAVEAPLHDTGYPGFAFEIDGLAANSLVSQYSVGERLLLTVVVSSGSLLSEEAQPSRPDASLARQAIEAEIARLEAKGLT